MKLGRLAALLREQALLQMQIAEELESIADPTALSNAANDAKDESEPLLLEKRPRRPPTLVRPAGEARFGSSKTFADKILRERGFR